MTLRVQHMLLINYLFLTWEIPLPPAPTIPWPTYKNISALCEQGEQEHVLCGVIFLSLQYFLIEALFYSLIVSV